MARNPLRLIAARFFRIPTVLALLLAGCATTPDSQKPEPVVFPSPPEEARFYWERTVIGTGAVAEIGREQFFKSLVTGESARGGEALAKPFDVAVHRGRMFLTDTVRRSVVAMDFVEKRSFYVGERGREGELHRPLGIAVSDDGRLFVCDAGLKRVLVFDRDGGFLDSVGDEALFDRPSGIDVSADGSRLFVVDTGGVDSDRHRVLVFDVASGEVLEEIGTRGSELGEMNLPRDVVLGPDGLLYVSDGGNFRIQVFTQEGDFVRAWGEPGKHLGQFTRLKGISVDTEGNIYAVDAAFGNFQIFDPQGRLLLFVGARSTERGPARYMLPAGIDVDEDGRVYMIDQFFRKVDIFRPAGIAEDQGYLAGHPLEPKPTPISAR